jgi:predicted transcriptional regulator
MTTSRDGIADYPTVAPNYAEARPSLARKMGLGQQRRRAR